MNSLPSFTARDDDVPLYQQLKDHVLRSIRSGNLRPRDRVPSESELVQQFGVSRMTANRALRELARDGYVVRQAGVDMSRTALRMEGVKSVHLCSLETLEELGMRAAEDFEAHGGERLVLVPSLNASDAWADTVVALARETAPDPSARSCTKISPYMIQAAFRCQ